METSQYNLKIADEIKRIYSELLSLPDLMPDIKINRLFHQLVNISLEYKNINNDFILQQLKEQVEGIRKVCSSGEYELEKYWASKIINSTVPLLQLKAFPYLQNYESLAAIEWSLIELHSSGNLGNCLFIGSGPLPLSAILFEKYFEKLTLIDVSQEAICLGKSIIEKLAQNPQNFSFVCKDISDFNNYYLYDTIILAALVGSVDEKYSIIKQIEGRMVPESLLVLRSSSGLKRVLYPEIELDYLGKFLEVKCVYHPYNTKVINSIIIAQKF